MTASVTGQSSHHSTNGIRQHFIDYFVKNGHTAVPSAPLVPMNDPTLLFTNAGMVPFKNIFTGAETRDYVRAVSSQKCVRAGGKHNDLDNVGFTARHHTFFEMLGNFSFGDYFKEQAIHHAWSMVTKEFGLNADRLLVTVYHEDDEAFDLWRRIAGLSEERIIRIATSDNFWSMGDTGPCGPCSEIFYDHGEHIWGGPPGSKDEDGDRFIEIWNLVFMQYEQMAGGERVNLPSPSIDTGMGLERIAAVMQGVHDNYDTDTFRRLIEASVEVTGAHETDETRASHRVIADHLRAVSFLIADGVLPSNEGRGYVLRRIMRRAMRHAHLLGAKDLVMHRLTPVLVGEMGEAYPELGRAKSLIEETLKLEEDKFRAMLQKGLTLLDAEIGKLSGAKTLPGNVAFKLYDTYGFPLDLTQDALRGQGLDVDTDGFDAEMAAQKAKARAAWAGSGDLGTDKIWFEIEDQHGATEFLGYTGLAADGTVTALVQDGALVKELGADAEGFLVTNQTPFYGESGGQMGDTGTITADDFKAQVLDTAKINGAIHAHRIRVTDGTVTPDMVVHLTVDGARRDRIRANHSATHLLHAVLRNQLGEHVTQKGSLVAEDRLRFDISHPKAVTGPELRQIEVGVNSLIRGNDTVDTRLMTYDDALDAGAMALFGEKYGDEVRVLFMGELKDQEGRHFSVELCGGTHVKALGDIGAFVITSESAVSSGVRRIEALTGQAALDYLNQQRDRVGRIGELMKASPAELENRVEALLAERKNLEKELSEARRKAALGGGQSDQNAENLSGVAFMGRAIEGVSPKELKGLVDDAKTKLGSGVIALVAKNDGKAAIVVGVTDDLVERFSAVDLVRAGVPSLGGKGGGGRPDMAQAGGPDATGAEASLAAIKSLILEG